MTELKRPEIDAFEQWFMELYDDDTTPFCTYHSLEEVSDNDYAGDGFSSKQLADLLKRCWNTAIIIERKKMDSFLSQIADKLEEARRLRKEARLIRNKIWFKQVDLDKSIKLEKEADAIEEEVIKALRNQGGVK